MHIKGAHRTLMKLTPVVGRLTSPLSSVHDKKIVEKKRSSKLMVKICDVTKLRSIKNNLSHLVETSTSLSSVEDVLFVEVGDDEIAI